MLRFCTVVNQVSNTPRRNSYRLVLYLHSIQLLVGCCASLDTIALEQLLPYSYRVLGHLRVVRIFVLSSFAAVMVRSIPYMGRLNVLPDSVAPGAGNVGHIYGILTVVGDFS